MAKPIKPTKSVAPTVATGLPLTLAEAIATFKQQTIEKMATQINLFDN